FAGQMGPRLPSAVLIGASKAAASDHRSKPHVVGQPTLGTQARFDVTQAPPQGHLRKAQRQKVIPRRKRVAARHRQIADTICSSKLPMGNAGDHLSENRLASVHHRSDPSKPTFRSNREQPVCFRNHWKSSTWNRESHPMWDNIEVAAPGVLPELPP